MNTTHDSLPIHRVLHDLTQGKPFVFFIEPFWRMNRRPATTASPSTASSPADAV
jgi:hypothetical protein